MTASGQLRFPSYCGAVPAKSMSIDVAVDGDSRADVEQARARLEEVGALVAAVRELANGCSHDALGVSEELVHRRGDAVASAPRAELRYASLGEPVRSQLRT